MTFVEKGVVVTAVAVFGGLVAYKVLKKKKPELLEKGKKAVCDVKKKTSEVIDSAKASFREGYANA